MKVKKQKKKQFSPHWFPTYFAPYFSCRVVLAVQGTVRVTVISVFFQTSTFLPKSLSVSLAIALPLIPPLFWNALPGVICGSLFLASFRKRFKNLTQHQGIPTLILIIPWCSRCWLTPFQSLDTVLVLLHL